MLHPVHDGSCLRAEVAGGRRDAVRLLELDERRAGETSKLGRLVARGAGAARSYLVAARVEEDLESLNVVPRRTNLQIACEGSSCRRRNGIQHRLKAGRSRSSERLECLDEHAELVDEGNELRACCR